MNNKVNAFVYTSYNVAKENSTKFLYQNSKVKIIKL